ncbi:uncharacterized protein LOC112162572 [Oryzias melastigma]|uniref:uncharacterized protein LOC112162572 n=1 Tax=Oryzias melastigma TaxID=30732 RepID=UPI000CF83E0F|nr:uncharacterized protein LOC112162572 [Oryzias melastigma]
MPDPKVCLEALEALTGCQMQPTTEDTQPTPQLTPQDLVNIVALREFYKQEGFKELEYESIGTLSLQDDADMYSSPPALCQAPESSLKPIVKINLQKFFHREFDYDFTNVKDGNQKFLRGNEVYIRPCGWDRAALRVSQQYDGGDQWLGTGKDAWPVSYHGHNMDGSLGIILTRDGNPDDSPQFLEACAASMIREKTSGRGVYSTPDIQLAERYCKLFTSKVDGKRYKVVLQNRINPQSRKSCNRDGLWLVYIPENSTEVKTKAIVQESLRPYGLLLKKA